MSSPNPYQSPQAAAITPRVKEPRAAPRVRRVIALGFLAISIAYALAYSFLDEVVLRTSLGGWPLLIGTCVVSLAAAVVSRHLLLAPLCCFAGTMSGDLLVVLARGWRYAQVDVCVLLALAFSVPALVLTLVLRFVVPRLKKPGESAVDAAAGRAS